MILPPMVLRIRVSENGSHKVRLWIPLFLVWPLVLAFTALFAPGWLAICLLVPRARRYAFAGPRVLTVLWALRGLCVTVDDADDSVLVSFS